jgi:hypothetical protein
MSFTQQEKGTATAECARQAMSTLARAMGMTAASTPSRDFVSCHTAESAEHKFVVWVTTPFEPTQANHIVWAKYQEIGGEGKIGIAFKLANSFSVDDIVGVLKKAQENAVKLPAGEPFTLKGNPPPRFQKKAKPTEAPADAPAEKTEG